MASPTAQPKNQDSSISISNQVEDLISQMSLEEKIGQMTLVDRRFITPDEVGRYEIGAILSGGGANPADNSPSGWLSMVRSYLEVSQNSRLGIPLLYGVDAVHGHNNLYGAVIFPHNIGLGAARDPDLVSRVADGSTTWGTSTGIAPPVPASGITEQTKYFLDQDDSRLDEAALRSVHLAPYIAAVKAGAQVIMASFSSWNGSELHAHKYLLTEVLKKELGFSGFIVSDRAGIEKVSEDNYLAVVTCINAGIDMSMVPIDYQRFISNLRLAIENGAIPLSRVDDAVRRILTVKMRAGLFENPGADDSYLSLIGSPEHRELAREAAAKSLVLLINEGQVLPLAKSMPRILVAGAWADDIGLQCGGWTIEWLGNPGKITLGTSILEGIQAAVSPQTVVDYDPSGIFDQNGGSTTAEVGLVFLGELHYAEGFGDKPDLALSQDDQAILKRMRHRCQKVVVVLITGRPLIITEQLPLMESLVAAWLPGSEGQGVADVLFGDIPFNGKLPYTWPRSMDQIPLDNAVEADTLFPYSFGLS